MYICLSLMFKSYKHCPTKAKFIVHSTEYRDRSLVNGKFYLYLMILIVTMNLRRIRKEHTGSNEYLWEIK